MEDIRGLAIFILFIIIIIMLAVGVSKREKLRNKFNKNKKVLETNFYFLKSLIDAIPNPIFYKNAKGEYIACNTHFEKFIGLKREDLIGKTVFEVNQGELAKNYHLHDIELMKTRGTQSYETKVKFADGTVRDVLFSKAVVMNNEEEVSGIVGVMLDITERKRTEDKIKRISKLKEAMLVVSQCIIGIDDSSKLFELILDKAIEAIDFAMYGSILLVTEDRHLIIIASRGYDEKKVKEFRIPLEESFQWVKTRGNIKNTIIINDIDELDNISILNISIDKSAWNIKSCISSPIIIDNKLYGMLNIDSNKKNAFSEDDLEIMEYMRTQIEIFINKHRLYEEITYLSRHDKLTGLYNRSYFEHILNNDLKNIKEFNLVVFDLNELKFVNDNFGHGTGDYYIQNFAKELKNKCTDKDILARYGGDEFIGIFFHDVETLERSFKELLEKFRINPINLKENRVVCSFSYGIANFPQDSSNYEELIKIADDRMYRFKQKVKRKFST